MDWSWIGTTWTAAAMTLASAVGIYLALIAATRLAGLRSFSKMSSFDFVITVAIGSVIATTVVAPDPPLLQGAVALGWLYALQYGLSRARRRSVAVRGAVVLETTGDISVLHAPADDPVELEDALLEEVRGA